MPVSAKHCKPLGIRPKDYFWPLFGLGLAATIVTISGILLCCIGIYFTMIIAYVAQVMTYRMLWNDEQEGADEDQFVRFWSRRPLRLNLTRRPLLHLAFSERGDFSFS